MAANVHPLTGDFYGQGPKITQKHPYFGWSQARKSRFFGIWKGKVKNGHFKNVQNAKSNCLSLKIFEKLEKFFKLFWNIYYLLTRTRLFGCHGNSQKIEMPNRTFIVRTIHLPNHSTTMSAPNLGGFTINLVAKDDAAHVRIVRAADVMNGSVLMPFCHPRFAMDYYRKIGREDYAKKFEIVYTLTRIRNRRLMRKINKKIAEHDGKAQFDVDNMEFINEHEVAVHAKALGISMSKYLDESPDEDDVEQCSNSWCLDQKDDCGEASDNVVIITDLDGVDWFVLIIRLNGPGREQLAWAGGFVDKGESFRDAAIREMDEEIEVGITGKYTTTYTDIEPVYIMDWDPRAKFAKKGMKVAARVTHHVFIAKNVGTKQSTCIML